MDYIVKFISSLKIDRRCIFNLAQLVDMGNGIGYATGHHLSTRPVQAGLMKNIDCMFFKFIFL